jgi:hypothetical protein
MNFSRLTIGIFRRWQAEKKVVALILQSHGEHTEAAKWTMSADHAPRQD